MRISDWSADVCSSDLAGVRAAVRRRVRARQMGIARDGTAQPRVARRRVRPRAWRGLRRGEGAADRDDRLHDRDFALRHRLRSEEHTSELQSLMRISYAVFCLKTKKKRH